MRLHTVEVHYEVDLLLPDDEGGNPQADKARQNLEAFGARVKEFKIKRYTGAGKHEWVGSLNPSLQNLQACVKCMLRRVDATNECSGIA